MKWVIRVIGLFLSVLSFQACEREFVFRGGEDGLAFSTDTVMFDTIFTSIGSTTKSFLVYNPYHEDLSIEAIELAGGDESDFRLNINGYSENELMDVRVRSKDSLFIFVEVTIDPVGSNTPYVVTDSILFHTSQKMQAVKLIAYGQDVVLMRKKVLKSQTLTSDKPYLIYDYVMIDTAETVSIDPGARLYFYKDASMVVHGTLEVNGTLEEPVMFSGHRQEEWYEDKPGQWGYIHLMPKSGQSKLNHAIIKNGLMGILADSVSTGESGPIEISNCRIEHVSTYGILAQTSRLDVTNTVFGDCGKNAVALTVGGEYSFIHCTFANYFGWSIRTSPTIFLNNYFIDENENKQVVPLTKADFKNCIIYGRNPNELGFDIELREGEFAKTDAMYMFDHALIRVASDFDISDSNHFRNIIIDEEPSFMNTDEYNFRLDTLSAAKDVGKLEFGEIVPKDILGVSRLEDEGPDLGAYERKEEK